MADDRITDALSNVDLGPVLDDLKKTDTGQVAVKPDSTHGELDLGQFKNPKDMLKSYKEIQAAFTRVTQENKQFKGQMDQLQQELEMSKLSQDQGYMPPAQDNQQQIYEDPNMDIDQRIQRTVATQRIADVLEDEADKNKAEFQERYAFAQMVAREYPRLSTSPRGVKKLFELGDKLRTDNLKKSAGKALESIFGEPLSDEEINKLRTMVKGDKAIRKDQNLTNAYMPDTSTSTRTGSESDRKPNYDDKLNDAVNKGDVDGTIDALFEGVLAE